MKLLIPLKLLKRAFYISNLLLVSCLSFSQQKDFVVPKNIPPFNLVLSDGVTSFNASNLEKNKPVMIIYFDPDCEHCTQFTRSVVKNIKLFSNTQIIMICGTGSINSVKKFVRDNALNKYPVIKVGTEGIYHTTMNFYHVYITPFTALYNSNGSLIKYYRNVPAINDLVVNLKK